MKKKNRDVVDAFSCWVSCVTPVTFQVFALEGEMDIEIKGEEAEKEIVSREEMDKGREGLLWHLAKSKQRYTCLAFSVPLKLSISFSFFQIHILSQAHQASLTFHVSFTL